jgi:hypothetical protein
VAAILLKPNPEDFTSHCWRRTSATQAADQGASSLQMIRHFGWKSEAMCEEYIDKSGLNINKMASTLQVCHKFNNF